ncbi:helix-turn-helix domain-containing protein [Dyadobacter fanqingshengii]|uniref:helix-turn-helix domain-containing protein n=1 Tax=Dyadobacter fanqingshengii TaxID=2906443 RepID=UPI0035B6578B
MRCFQLFDLPEKLALLLQIFFSFPIPASHIEHLNGRQRIENGKVSPSLYSLYEIATALNVRLEELVNL